jgi:lysyl-tRNA synthetase class I
MGWIIPKGKYKGYDVDEINDRSYCQFMLDNWDLNILEEKAIRNAMDSTGKDLNQKLTPGTQFITHADVKKVTDFIINKSHNDSYLADTPEGDRARQFFKDFYKILTGKDYA